MSATVAPRSLHREANDAPLDQLGLVLTAIARFLVVCALFTAAWGMGGYFPVARFITLAFLTTAAVFVGFGGLASRQKVAPAIPMLMVMFAALGYGALQLIPDSSWSLLEWTGVRSIQYEFGAGESGIALSQSLVPWMTHSWLSMAMIAVAGFFLSACLFHDDRGRIVLLAAIAICGIGQVFWGVVQVSVYPDKIFWGIDKPLLGGSPFGTFLNRNHAADFIGMSLFSLLGIARFRFASDSQRWNSGYGVTSHFRAVLSNPLTLGIWLAIIWLLFGMVLTLSRAGWATCLIALVVIPLCWQKSHSERRGAIIFAGIISLVMVYGAVQFFGFGDRIDSRLDDLEVQHVLTDSRFDHWAEAFPAALHFLPFGAGLGTYGYAYLPFEPEPEKAWFTHAHNQYLEVLMEAGIPGLAILAIAMVIAFRAGIRLCSSKRSASKQALGIAVLAAVAMQALHAVTDFGLMMPGNLLTLAVLVGAGCVAGVKRQTRKRRKSNDPTKTLRTVEPEMPSPNPELVQPFTVDSFKQVGFVGINILILCLVGLALWQQGRHVRMEKLLAKTSFAPSTPSPTVNTSEERIAELRDELIGWPEFEPALRRVTRLEIHVAQRQKYDELRNQQTAIDPITGWDRVSLESVVVKLHDTETVTDKEKSEIVRAMQSEPELSRAWEGMLRSLGYNSVQPRIHMRMAQLGAATGRPWRESFERSMRLSVIDPRQSLLNGLLAWAAGDRASMIAQWRRSLYVDAEPSNTILKLSRTYLTEDEFVSKLVPDRWTVPFRLSRNFAEQGDNTELRVKLLAKSEEIARNTLIDTMARERALGIIASERGDSKAAFEHYEKAIQSNPHDAKLRYRASVALYQLGDTKQAISHARVATLLAPRDQGLHNFYHRILRKQKHRYSKHLESSSEPNSPQSE